MLQTKDNTRPTAVCSSSSLYLNVPNTFLQVRDNLLLITFNKSLHFVYFFYFFQYLISLFATTEVWRTKLVELKVVDHLSKNDTKFWNSLENFRIFYRLSGIIVTKSMDVVCFSLSSWFKHWLNRDLLSNVVAMQLDNTAKENKNQYLFCFMGYLVKTKVFDTVTNY